MAESRRQQFEAKFADSAQYTPMVHAQVDDFLDATAGPGAALRMARMDVRKLFRLEDMVEAGEESEGAEHVRDQPRDAARRDLHGRLSTSSGAPRDAFYCEPMRKSLLFSQEIPR